MIRWHEQRHRAGRDPGGPVRPPGPALPVTRAGSSRARCCCACWPRASAARTSTPTGARPSSTSARTTPARRPSRSSRATRTSASSSTSALGAPPRSTAHRSTVGDRVVPAPNRACGRCRLLHRRLPLLLLREPRELRQLAHVGRSLRTCSAAGSEYLYLLPDTPVFKVPAELPDRRRRAHRALRRHAQPRPGRGHAPPGRLPRRRHRRGGRRRPGRTRPRRQGRAHRRRPGHRDRPLPRPPRHRRQHSAPPTSSSGRTTRRRAAAEVRELLAPDGVDVVVDATGHPSSFGPWRWASSATAGRSSRSGAFVDLGTVPINPADILGRNLTIVGVAGEDSQGRTTPRSACSPSTTSACPSTAPSRTASPSSRPTRPCRPPCAPTTP